MPYPSPASLLFDFLLQFDPEIVIFPGFVLVKHFDVVCGIAVGKIFVTTEVDDVGFFPESFQVEVVVGILPFAAFDLVILFAGQVLPVGGTFDVNAFQLAPVGVDGVGDDVFSGHNS